MELTIDELNAITRERSEREVQIAKLTLELDQRKSDIVHLLEQVDTLRGQLEAANRKAEEYAVNLDQERYYNSVLRRVIMLSREKVKLFFNRIKDVQMLAVVQAFVLKVLPDDTSEEQKRQIEEITQLPLPLTDDTPPKVVNVSGNYIDAHDNNHVKL